MANMWSRVLVNLLNGVCVCLNRDGVKIESRKCITGHSVLNQTDVYKKRLLYF